MSGPTKKDRLLNKAKSLGLLVDRSMTAGQIERLISTRLSVDVFCRLCQRHHSIGERRVLVEV